MWLLCYPTLGPYHKARIGHLLAESADISVNVLVSFDSSLIYHDHVRMEGVHHLLESGDASVKWTPSLLLRLWQRLDQLNADVLFINGYREPDALLMHLWARWKGVARVLVSDSHELHGHRQGIREWFKRRILRGCDVGFVAGSPQARYAQRLGVAHTVFGCDTVDNAHFHHAARSFTGYRLLTVCRLVPAKNLLWALRWFLRWCERQPDKPWCWHVAGYGELEQELRELASASGDRIHYLGPVDYADLPATYARADIYVQPSLDEPWGLTVNEAMAAGLPVMVSSLCGCVEDLVDERNGWVFDPRVPDDFMACLDRMAAARNDWPAMRQASERRIADWGLQRFRDGLVESALAAEACG